MAHGRSNAILLPHVMNYNLSGNLEKFANIAEAMAKTSPGLSPYEAAALSVEGGVLAHGGGEPVAAAH